MKNATRCAGPAYYRDVLNRRLLLKQTSSSTKGNHHPSFLRFWNWANCRCNKFVAAQKMLVKQKTSKHS